MLYGRKNKATPYNNSTHAERRARQLGAHVRERIHGVIISFLGGVGHVVFGGGGCPHVALDLSDRVLASVMDDQMGAALDVGGQALRYGIDA